MFAEKPRVHILRANSKSNDVQHLGLADASSTRTVSRIRLPLPTSYPLRPSFGMANDSSLITHYESPNLAVDIIIDDGDHYPPVMEKTLHRWWRFLKPGGYYCVEDVATGANAKGQRYGGRGPFFPPGRPRLAWPGLAWPGLAWPGLSGQLSPAQTRSIDSLPNLP